MNQLMDALGSDAFAATQRNAAYGVGNVDPRQAYRQQAHVQLSDQAEAWLTAQLEEAFRHHGKLPQANLNELDWPKPVR